MATNTYTTTGTKAVWGKDSSGRPIIVGSVPVTTTYTKSGATTNIVTTNSQTGENIDTVKLSGGSAGVYREGGSTLVQTKSTPTQTSQPVLTSEKLSEISNKQSINQTIQTTSKPNTFVDYLAKQNKTNTMQSVVPTTTRGYTINGFDYKETTKRYGDETITTTEKSINPTYRETLVSSITRPFSKDKEPVLTKKSTFWLKSEKVGSMILSSKSYKTVNKGLDIYTEKAIKYTPLRYSPVIPIYNKLYTGKASYDTKGATEFSNIVRKSATDRILENPVRTGLIYASGYAVGGGLTQLKSGLGSTGLKIFKGSEILLGGSTVAITGYGLVKSEDKAKYIGETSSDFITFGVGAYRGSKLSSKYSTVQARATRMSKNLELDIKPITTKQIKTISEPRAIINEEGSIIGINKKKPAMFNKVQTDKIIGQRTKIRGKNYLSDTITIGKKTSQTIKRSSLGKDFITKVNIKGNKGTLQVYDKNLKPIGVKQTFTSESIGKIGISEPIKVSSTEENLFLNKQTGERKVVLTETYKQSVVSKSKDIKFTNKDIYTTISKNEDLGLGRIAKQNNIVSDVKPKQTLNLETQYIVTPTETFKEIKGRSFNKNKIILSGKSEYPADVVSLTKEKYNPTVFRNTKTIISSEMRKNPKYSQIKEQTRIKNYRESIFGSEKGTYNKQILENKPITVQKVKLTEIKAKTMIPKYELKIITPKLTTTPKILLSNTKQGYVTKQSIRIETKPTSIIKQSFNVKQEPSPITRLDTSTSQISLIKQQLSIKNEIASSNVGYNEPKLSFVMPELRSNIKVPKPTPFIPSGGFGKGKGFGMRKQFKQVKGYTPTLFSSTLKIKGSTSRRQRL